MKIQEYGKWTRYKLSFKPERWEKGHLELKFKSNITEFSHYVNGEEIFWAIMQNGNIMYEQFYGNR